MTLSFFSKAAGKLHWLNRSWVPTSPTSGTSGHTTLLRRLRHTTYSCWWWCCRDVLALSTTCALTQKRRTMIKRHLFWVKVHLLYVMGRVTRFHLISRNKQTKVGQKYQIWWFLLSKICVVLYFSILCNNVVGIVRHY